MLQGCNKKPGKWTGRRRRREGREHQDREMLEKDKCKAGDVRLRTARTNHPKWAVTEDKAGKTSEPGRQGGDGACGQPRPTGQARTGDRQALQGTREGHAVETCEGRL